MQQSPSNVASAPDAGKPSANMPSLALGAFPFPPLLRVHAAGCPAPIAGAADCTCHVAIALARQGRIAA